MGDHGLNPHDKASERFPKECAKPHRAPSLVVLAMMVGALALVVFAFVSINRQATPEPDGQVNHHVQR